MNSAAAAPRTHRLDALLNGRFDVVLAGLTLARPLIPGGHQFMLAAGLDVVLYGLAALAPYHPRIALTALGVGLASLLVVPQDWPMLGEYAALIAILGTGLRGQRWLRLWVTLAYGLILGALTVRHVGSAAGYGVLIWGVLIAILWAIGDLFTGYRAAQARSHTAQLESERAAHAAALQEQRLSLARDLHDTVARDLSRASLRAQSALTATPSEDLEATLTQIQQASTHLRWMLGLLRNPAEPEDGDSRKSIVQALTEAQASLNSHGFTSTPVVSGALDTVPSALAPVLVAVVGEATSNIEKHGDPSEPCAIMIDIDERQIEMVFLNVVADRQHAAEPHEAWGLSGLRERLTLIDGSLEATQEGQQWITHVRVPM